MLTAAMLLSMLASICHGGCRKAMVVTAGTLHPMLNVHTYGAPGGRPILAIHGVTGHGERYARTADALPGYTIHSVDLRGHGRSTYDPPWTGEQHVSDLLATMDTLDLERPVVMGHSFGGYLTTRLLATAPERVARAILLDPAIAIAPADAREAAHDSLVDVSWPTLEEAVIGRREGRAPGAIDASDADALLHVEQSADGRFRARYSRAAAIAAWSEMARAQVSLSGVDVPVLLVTALQAPYVTDGTRAWLRRDLGDRFSEIQIDCSHMVFWDGFDEMIDGVRTFLADGS